MSGFEKIVVVTRQTRLQELIARFNTRSQAQFYIEHSGGDFADYDNEDKTYEKSLHAIKRQLNAFSDLRVQYVDRTFVSNFVFAPSDLIVVVGQDGLVANTAKYVGSQPIIGVNPDPKRIDGVLVPTAVPNLKRAVEQVLSEKAAVREVTLAQVETNDGQKLLAFNDLYIGARSHVSARYSLEFGGRSEQQSSSGIIVSTGAGSTGWLSSVFNMVASVEQFMGVKQTTRRMPMRWDDPSLMFVVREPFISRHSSAQIVAGLLRDHGTLKIESRMSTEGAIFSDGIESDFIPFNAGTIARIGIAPRRARLVVSQTVQQERGSAGAYAVN
jgi:NAD kinase